MANQQRSELEASDKTPYSVTQKNFKGKKLSEENISQQTEIAHSPWKSYILEFP